jgi:polyisoprenoid-binding protein YceI
MKKIIYPAAVFIIGLLAFSLAVTNWKVKPGGAVIKFTSGKINGSFSGLKASILFDPRHPEQAKISASVDATSIATGFFLKNSHAKDALGVDQHPAIKFVSGYVSKNGNAYVAKGTLTLRGVSRPAAIYFTFSDKGSQGVFSGNMKVAPRQFGIDHAGTPQTVMVTLTVPASK